MKCGGMGVEELESHIFDAQTYSNELAECWQGEGRRATFLMPKLRNAAV